MAEWRLIPHGGRALPSVTKEEEVIDYIEGLTSGQLTLHILEHVVNTCVTGEFHYALVFLGDFLMKKLGYEPDVLYEQVQHMLDDSVLQKGNFILKKTTSVEEINLSIQNALGRVIDDEEDDVGASTIHVLEVYSTLMNQIAEHYHQPCMQRMEGTGYGTWLDQKAHIGDLLHCNNPRFSQFLPLIRFLAKKPLMDCTSPSTMDNDLLTFDQKWDRWLVRYPIIEHMLDPPLVVIELVPPVPANVTVAGLLAPLLNQFQVLLNAGHPLPLLSNIIPVQLDDPAGPQATHFDSIFVCGTCDDAKTFAGILRTHFRNANILGGGGPAARIAVSCTTPRNFRVY